MELNKAIDTYFEHLKANGRSPACRSYKPYFKTFSKYMVDKGKYSIGEVYELDWYQFVGFLEGRYRQNSRAYCINALKPFFRYWSCRGESRILPDTIVTQRYYEIPREVLDDDEYEALLETIGEEGVIACRDALMVRILAETGMRVSELLALNIVDLGTGQDCTAMVRTRKNQDLGYVMWGKETNQVLHKWLGYRICYEGEAVFMSCSPQSFGKRLTSRSVERIIRERTSLITPKRITPHCLRHTRAHNLLKGGATAEEFNLLLRHRGWNSRFKYLRLSRSEFIGMAQKYLFKTFKKVV